MSLPCVPFQPKMKKSVAKAYSEKSARVKNRMAGEKIHDVENRYVGSRVPSRPEVCRFQIAMLLNAMGPLFAASH